MADRRPNPFEKDQLRREATKWFVQMRGPDAEQHRADFERWLARGALHRTAYNRITNLYSAGKRVNWENLPPAQPVRGTAKRMWMVSMSIAAVIGFITWRAIASPVMIDGTEQHHTQLAADPGDAAKQYSTRLGEIREVVLPDGSKVALDTDTLLSVDFSSTERQPRLEHGRARFEVAHEARPFVVDAGDTIVIARGTIFDVAYLEPRSVDVRLIQGAIDVKQKRHSANEPAVRLNPGQGIRYTGQSAQQFLPTAAADQNSGWPSGMVEFRKARLSAVIAEANRYATAKIVIEDAAIGRTEISGVFRVDEPEKLAQHLAQLLGLRLKRTAGQIILSRP